MPINLELHENFDGSLDGRYKQGNKPSSPTLLRVVSFDGLSNGQTDSGFDWYLGNTAFANGFGTRATTLDAYNGASSSLALSIKQGSDGDPAGGSTGVGYGAFGGGLSLGADSVSQGQELWVGLRIKLPTGFDLATNFGALKFIRYGVAGHAYMDNHINNSGGSTSTGWTISNENEPISQTYTRKVTRDTLTTGSWHWVEMYIKPNSNGLLSTRRVWLNGVLQFERDGKAQKWLHTDGSYQTDTLPDADGDTTLPASDDVIDKVLFFTYWNGYAPQDQELYIQNIALHKDASTLTQVDSFGNKIIGGL